ncbi:hypothetical protein ACH5RR_041009 [Cinchona calisaya]|uniref:Uncharacterized protein n=1 Tax=Cinchona calisaya TaxID=153742 RepID=A0ABD2XVC7_9GENT
MHRHNIGVSKKVTNNPALKESSAKKRLLEPIEKEVDNLFLSKFYERLDRFTKDVFVDFIRSCKTIEPRKSEGIRSSLVEDGLIRSVEFFADESSAQHGPTTFGSLGDFESFMSSLPLTKDIYNLFDNGVFVKGSGFLQTKRTKKVKRFPSCAIRDVPRPSTPLRGLSPTKENLVKGKEVVSEESSEGESYRSYTDDLILPPQVTNVSYGSIPINVSHFYEILKDFIVKSHKLALLGENRPLVYEACLEVTHSQLESLNEEYGKLVRDISFMKNSLNILDGEINKLETSLSLLQTRRATEAQTLNKHESTLIHTSQKLLALKIEFDDLKSSADCALAEEKVHSEDSEKLKKAMEALNNQFFL